MNDRLVNPPQCPVCGSSRVIAIIYGMPDRDLQEKAMDGEVILGGERVSERQPEWRCRTCDFEWKVRESTNGGRGEEMTR